MPARTVGVLELSMRPHIRRSLLKDSKIVIPPSSFHEKPSSPCNPQVLHAIHMGHHVCDKCTLRPKESVIWPGVSIHGYYADGEEL